LLRLNEPSWNLIAQNIVRDCASASGAAINQMMSICNPATWAGALNTLREPQNIASLGDRAGVRDTKPAAVMDLQDPAYSAIHLVNSYLAGLRVIIKGDNGIGIDWEKARGDGTLKGAGGNIAFLAQMLQGQRDSFGTAMRGEASVELTRILETSVRVGATQFLSVAIGLTHRQIALEINDVVQDSFDMKALYPANNSEKVKNWKMDFKAVHRSAKYLAAKAKSIPGTPAIDPPIAAPPSAKQTAPIDANSMQAQTALADRKDRLAVTQENLTSTQANYTKTTEMLLKQQEKLGEIQTKLTILSNSSVSLVSIHPEKKFEWY
jgi:hypothetical protein